MDYFCVKYSKNRRSDFPGQLSDITGDDREESNDTSNAERKDLNKTRENKTSSVDEAAFFMSLLYGLFVVLQTIVFKVSQYITLDIVYDGIDLYFIFLLSIGIAWLIFFSVLSTWMKKSYELVKNQRSTNRWLKGVLAVFGLCVIIRNMLQFIAFLQIDDPHCTSKSLFVAKNVLYSIMVLGEVAIIFFHAKVHIQTYKLFSRLGLIHLIATNLSMWINQIADEAAMAILETQSVAGDASNQNTSLLPHATQPGNAQACVDELKSVNTQLTSNCVEIISNSTLFWANTGATISNSAHVPLFYGNCTCLSLFCRAAMSADTFLFPFVVDFCLVSSCLLYVMWKNVGNPPENQHQAVKPSYKLYKSYKGFMIGGVVVAAMIVILIILGTLQKSSTSTSESYFILLYDLFMIFTNSLLLLGCLTAFYIFSIGKHRVKTKTSAGLDAVLLGICLVGPLLLELLSIFGLISGYSDLNAKYWGLSLTNSLLDIALSTTQVVFILHYLDRQPLAEENFAYQAGKLTIPEDEPQTQVANTVIEETNEVQELGGGNFLHSRHNEKTGEKSSPPNKNLPLLDKADNRPHDQHTKHRTNQKLRLAYPDTLRLHLRDIMVVLIMANSCMWLFLSLEETAFSVVSYPYVYFGHSAWTTFTMLTNPFIFFLRMHSAGCLFEIWSYT